MFRVTNRAKELLSIVEICWMDENLREFPLLLPF